MENRKKRTNIIGFAFTLFLAFLIITFGFFWAVGSTSYAKTQYAEKNTKEVKKITDESVEQIENIDTEAIVNSITTVKEDFAQENEEVIKQGILAELTKKYDSIMENQKAEAFNMLDDLIAQAKESWEDVLAKGENTPIVRGEKASEYVAMVNVMEKNMDQSFETVLAKMKEQLEAEGIDPNPVLNQYREEYKSIKDENRQIMMDKAINTIKGKEL